MNPTSQSSTSWKDRLTQLALGIALMAAIQLWKEKPKPPVELKPTPWLQEPVRSVPPLLFPLSGYPHN